MPIFEYHCPRCDADFEEIVRSAETAVTCASCGHAGVSRKLSVFAFRSKGSDRPSARSVALTATTATKLIVQYLYFMVASFTCTSTVSCV